MRGTRNLCMFVLAMLMTSAAPVAAVTIIDLNVTDPDVRFPGAADQDFSGQTVLVGDFDGDTIDDVIIGAPSADFSGRDGCGTIYIYLSDGNASGTIELGSGNANLRRIHGPATGTAIGAVIACGDINNDDRDDIIIGIPAATVNGRSSAGQVFAVLGSDNPPADLDLAIPNALFFEVQGAAQLDKLGTSVAVGNVNDDNFGDVVMGAPFASSPDFFAGKIFVMPGAASFNAVYDMATPPAGTTVINGANVNDTFGTACFAADVNDDGVDDIIGGAPQATPPSRSFAGIAYIIPGSAALAATINTSDGASAGIVQIYGPEANALAGSRFASADIDGDTVDDLVVAAPETNALGRTSAGAVYVLAGTDSWADVVDLSTTSMVRIDGPAANVKLGLTLATGDLNADGYNDLTMGTPAATPFVGRDDAGIAYTIFGRDAAVFPSSIDLAVNQNALTKVYGASKSDNAGRSVAIGAIDNDVFDDLLIGADNVATGNGVSVGESYVIYGSDAITPTQLLFYDVSTNDGRVRIVWGLADDLPASTLRVQREGAGGQLILAATGIERTGRAQYALTDRSATAGESYRYTVSVTGEEHQLLFTTTVHVPTASGALVLRAHPNPTRGQSSIEFTMPGAGRAQVAVYDVRGRRVAELANREFPAGVSRLDWDGTTAQGTVAAAGVYFIRLSAQRQHVLQKLLIVR